MIDFHTHILPKTDDGSKNIEESLAMLEMEAAQGITHVAATPHFYAQHDSPEKFLARRQAAFDKLNQAISDSSQKLPKITLGAEVYYFSGISSSSIISEMAIKNTSSILIEMPSQPWSNSMLHELEEIYSNFRVTPIIAHIDRYINRFNVRSTVESLSKFNVIIQANASFFISRFTRKLALSMLDDGIIRLLGSDCHNIKERKPNLGTAMQIITDKLGANALDTVKKTQQDLFETSSEIFNG